jgi:alpha-glucosidase (family GH31 glycosyl hydrolase)
MKSWNPKADDRAIVKNDHYRFTVLSPSLLRLEWSPSGTFEDRATQLVVNRRLEAAPYELVENPDRLIIRTSDLCLEYDRQAFSPEGLSISVTGCKSHRSDRWRYHESDSDDERFNLGGTTSTLDDIDGSCPLDKGLIDRRGYVAIEDNSLLILDEDWPQPRNKEKGSIDLYFFAYNSDPAKALRDFYSISGYPPLIPRYALGNWWSRYHKYTEASYTELIQRFEEEGIPLSVSVIDMDWHKTSIDEKHGSAWTGLSWDRELFPDPDRFMKTLHDKGLKITLNLHPASGVRSFEDCYVNTCKALGKDASKGEPIAFDVADQAFMTAYIQQALRPLAPDFWWIDWQQSHCASKSDYDELWMLNYCLYKDNEASTRYPMILSRYAGLGSHRYPIGFSGDTVMSWKSLEFQPYFTLTSASSGFGWWSHDIGGHLRGIWDDELELRWLQLGVFSPIFRLHSSNSPMFIKEPWTFPIQIREPMKAFMRLRHALVPYLYCLAIAHSQGSSLISPMYYQWPAFMAIMKSYPNQYLLGPSLAVFPITRPMEKSVQAGWVDAWVPPGRWYDIFSFQAYDGDRSMRLYRKLDSYPVMAKEGSILPLGEDSGNGTPLPRRLKLLVFCGCSGSFTLIEDDQQDPDRRAMTDIELQWGEDASLSISKVRGDASIVPETRDFTIVLVGLDKPEELEGALYDEQARTLTVKAEGISASKGFSIALKHARLALQDSRAQCIKALAGCQMDNQEKLSIYNLLRKDIDDASCFASLHALTLDAHVIGLLAEILGAYSHI